MKRLPYIGEYATPVAASRDATWKALLQFGLRDDGHAMRGFVIHEKAEPERLALRGQHWFSTYELVFLLDADGSNTRLRAQTWAEFPGLHGKAYRALVIGSGGHRIVVRRMLAGIAKAAETVAG